MGRCLSPGRLKVARGRWAHPMTSQGQELVCPKAYGNHGTRATGMLKRSQVSTQLLNPQLPSPQLTEPQISTFHRP